MTALGLAAAAMVGALLGVGYFGGLWWTVARLGRWRRPGAALLLGFALRHAIAVVVFVAFARAGAAPLLAAFVGFIAARPLVAGALGPRRSGGAPRSPAAATPPAAPDGR